MKKILAFFLFLLGFNLAFSQKIGQSNTDKATTSPRPYNYEINANYKGIEIQTVYIEMRDGVKLAADIYLPKGLKTEKLPVILHQTRYWRSPALRWPFKMFSNGLIGRQGNMIQTVVENGYIIVNVDARGSGASYGSRDYPWTAEETKDGAEVIDWIIKQPWSSGKVGSMGVSYSGTTAEFLSFNKHPNLKAVFLMFSLYDVYDDIAYPGGVFQKGFVNDWGRYNAKMDEDKIPRGGFIAKLLVKGVRRVKTEGRKKELKQALEAHEVNMNVHETAKSVEYRGQRPKGVDIEGVDVFSPFTYAKEADDSGVAVYSYSGWWDGDYQHANIKRHLNLNNPENKLTIGPWEHGGRFNCSWTDPGEAGFDHVGEILKFFDYHLKGIANGLYEEPRVHYFTMVEDAWKASDVWPPVAKEETIYFGENQSLVYEAASIGGTDTYEPDTNAYTSTDSRWMSVIGKLKTPYVYPNRAEVTKKLLHYDSEALKEEIEISGHAIMKLYLSSDQTDGNFHVYLDDIAPDGKVHYISEGLLRGIHRKLVDGQPFYKDVVPQRTYFEEDLQALVPGEVSLLVFDILPTSYLLKKGHRLRISIAGADQTHFKVMHKASPKLDIYFGGDYPSQLLLPIKR